MLQVPILMLKYTRIQVGLQEVTKLLGKYSIGLLADPKISSTKVLANVTQPILG